jgi:nicotinate-nucleotide adenylyltransferase
MKPRVALFGGTFNPVHCGHLRVARAAMDELDLERVILMPCARPPHKTAEDLAPGADRLAMCRLAAQGDARLEVSDLEMRRPGPSYTVETLRALRAARPEAELVLLVGADMLRDLHLWRQVEEIVRLARVVTLPRAGVDPGPLNDLGRRIGSEAVDRLLKDVLATPLVDIASTEVRRRVRSGEPIDELVPAAVARYIAEHHLYR